MIKISINLLSLNRTNHLPQLQCIFSILSNLFFILHVYYHHIVMVTGRIYSMEPCLVYCFILSFQMFAKIRFNITKGSIPNTYIHIYMIHNIWILFYNPISNHTRFYVFLINENGLVRCNYSAPPFIFLTR